MTTVDPSHIRVRRSGVTWWVGTVLLQAVIVFLSFARFDQAEFSFAWLPVGFPDALTLAAVVVSVLARRRAPLIFVIVSAAPLVAFAFGATPPHSLFGVLLALLFAVYALTATFSPRWSVFILVALWALIATGTIVTQRSFVHVFPGTVTAGLAVAFAAGSFAYSRHRVLESVTHRAEEAERVRDAVAAAKVAEDRLSTARDLHDIVGHQIAVINLRAAVAERSIPETAHEARESLIAIQASADAILGQIGTLLRDLRNAPAERHSRAEEGLKTLPQLARSLTSAGLPIELEIARDVPTLPPATDEALYRMIEEALVNSYKYGAHDRSTHVNVELGAEGHVLVRVINHVRPDMTYVPSTGLGVLGIRERAAALGGRADVSSDADTYRLTIDVPRGDS